MTCIRAAPPAGHALVEALVAQGVDTVFGVPGESFLAALDGFHEHRDRIRFVACRQEGGAAFMAEAHGKLTGRPGVCFVTRGPGATNAAIGVHTAFQDSTPMVLFVGQVGERPARSRGVPGGRLPADVRARHAGLRQVGRRGARRRPRCPSTWRAPSAPRCRAGPGPVVLALPEDMLATPTVGAGAAARRAGARRAGARSALAQLARAAARGRAAVRHRRRQRLDGRRRRRRCSASPRDWQLPVGCAFRFQDTFDNRHPHYAGDVGIGINPKLAQRIRESDLVLAIGPRLGEMTTGGYTLLEAPRPRQKLVHIHAGAEELGRVYPADLAINASMALRRAARWRRSTPPTTLPLAGVDRRGARRLRRPTCVPTPVAPLDMAAVVARRSSATCPPDAIFTNGAGNFASWLHRFHRYAGLRQGPHASSRRPSGAMGYGVPAAHRREPAASRTHGRHHRRRRRLPDERPGARDRVAHGAGQGAGKLVSIVVDNGMLRHDPHAPGARVPGRASAARTSRNPDFAALARAYGWWAASASTRPRQFEPALRAALAAGPAGADPRPLDADVITTRTTLAAIRQQGRNAAHRRFRRIALRPSP